MDLTIVIPIYNRADCLLTTLDSIPTMYPLILVDNGSTDASLQVAEDYCRRRNCQLESAPAICITKSMPGAAAARNRGLALCTTEWVYFFDSDDLFTPLPDIDAQCSPAELDMICFPVRMVVKGRTTVRAYRPTASVCDHILSTMLGTQSMLFRTEWLRSIGGWDNRCRIWDDWELGVRALLHRPRLCWITDTVCHHIYVHDDSLTGPSFGARWEYILDALRVVREEVMASDDNDVQRAFNLRCYIVSGTLRHEGCHEAAAAIRQLAVPSLLGRCLETYQAHGGRGAWRIALAGAKFFPD